MSSHEDRTTTQLQPQTRAAKIASIKQQISSKQLDLIKIHDEMTSLEKELWQLEAQEKAAAEQRFEDLRPKRSEEEQARLEAARDSPLSNMIADAVTQARRDGKKPITSLWQG